MNYFENVFESTDASSFETPSIFKPFEEICNSAAEVEETENLGPSADISENLEKAPPMEIQALEIRDYFIEHPELHFENWKELSFEERLDAFNALEQYAAEVAKRPAMNVISKELEPGHRGYCNYKEICINKAYLLENDDFVYHSIFGTLLHEGRHAYQNYNIEAYMNGDVVVEPNIALVKMWTDSQYGQFGGYTNGSRPSMYTVSKYWKGLASDGVSAKDVFKMVFTPYSDLGFEEYYLQPIEVDARAFAQHVRNTIGI